MGNPGGQCRRGVARPSRWVCDQRARAVGPRGEGRRGWLRGGGPYRAEPWGAGARLGGNLPRCTGMGTACDHRVCLSHTGMRIDLRRRLLRTERLAPGLSPTPGGLTFSTEGLAASVDRTGRGAWAWPWERTLQKQGALAAVRRPRFDLALEKSSSGQGPLGPSQCLLGGLAEPPALGHVAR